MIVREQVTFSAQGQNFTPSKVSALFTEAHDPGALETWGPDKGIPTPYGAADFDVPEEEEKKIPFLHRTVLPYLAALRSAGAEDFTLHITYHCENQCAIGFSKDEIKMSRSWNATFQSIARSKKGSMRRRRYCSRADGE